jgi:hypothetical protein
VTRFILICPCLWNCTITPSGGETRRRIYWYFYNGRRNNQIRLTKMLIEWNMVWICQIHISKYFCQSSSDYMYGVNSGIGTTVATQRPFCHPLKWILVFSLSEKRSMKCKNVDVFIFEGLQHLRKVNRSWNACKLEIGIMLFCVFLLFLPPPVLSSSSPKRMAVHTILGSSGINKKVFKNT